jgi:hypothetical protein
MLYGGVRRRTYNDYKNIFSCMLEGVRGIFIALRAGCAGC